MQGNPRMSGAEWGLLVILSILWGGSFFFSKIAVEGLPPLTLVFIRFASASILLYAYLRSNGQGIPTQPSVWGSFLGMGLLNNLVPAGLIVWGQTMIPSGLASVLIATTPIFSILATQWVGTNETVTPGIVVGIALGVLGTILLFRLDSSDGSGRSVIGVTACLGAAVSYGFANAFGRRFQQLGIEPVMGAFGQMTATSVITLPLMLAFDAPWLLPFPGVKVWACMVGLVLLSTVLGYVIFFRILAKAGATNISLVTLLIPASAVFLGSAVLGETLSSIQLLGMLLIGSGLLAIDGRPSSAAWRAVKTRHISWGSPCGLAPAGRPSTSSAPNNEQGQTMKN